MPTRMIRDALLGSDRFLMLPDNTARVCFVACLLRADDRGNLEAGPGHLVRLWRDFGVDCTEKAAAIGQSLADQDLIRFYDADDKRYAHIPRFGQRLRSFKRACPASPWSENAKESTDLPLNCQQVAANGGKLRPEEKRSEVNIPLVTQSGDQLFFQFWEAYPRKVAKQDAIKAWQKIKPSAEVFTKILTALESFKGSSQWRSDNGKFIPHPATWLNGRRFEDDLKTATPEKRMVI